jgi:predicted short-subunit dehydrogenase-like oxidoreductase (DUF2520 family)
MRHAAIPVDAEHLEYFATIGFSKTAGVTSAAVQVGLDTAMSTHFKVSNVAAQCKNFDAQLVAENSWILNEGHLAQVATQICATNSNGTDSYQSFVGPWR